MTVEPTAFRIRNPRPRANHSFLIAFVFFCFLVPCVLGARTGPDGALLRYRFEPGVSYALVVGLDLVMDTQVEGLPPEAAALAAAGQDMKQRTSMTLSLQAGPRARDGSQPLTVRVEDAQATLSRQGRVLRAQGLEERLEGAVLLDGTLSSDGRTIELAPSSDANVPDASRELLGLMLQLLPSFPDRALAPGDSFEVPVRFTAPEMGGDLKLETRGTCTYTLRSVEGGRARFDVRAEGTADASGDPTHKLSMVVDNHGTAEFNIAEGIFTALYSELSIDLALDTELPPTDAVPPGAVLDFTPSTAPTKLQVRASAKGPLELAMARVSAERK